MILAYNTTTERIVQRYWGDGIPEWYNDPPEGIETAEIPDDEFPTPNRIDKNCVSDAVLDRIRDNFPAERTPHDSVPWADDGLNDDETRISVYYWDNGQVRLETEIKSATD